MRLISTTLLALSLTGCMYQSVNSNDIEAANKLCASKDAIVIAIQAHATGSEFVLCSNRALYKL
jgi:hypothetical protein